MTLAGSNSITTSDAFEVAVQICNFANSKVQGIDVSRECRSRTNVQAVMLDGQPPAQGKTEDYVRGWV